MDWEKLCDDHSVDYVNRGPNTKRGEISVRCPYCAEDDPSQHMGISLTSENWGCHRDPRHRGHAPHVLVGALLGCLQAEARLIVQQYSRPDPETLDAALAALTGTNEAPAPQTAPLSLPDSFRAIEQTGSTGRFWRYLESRGFDDVPKLVDDYRLACCLTGRWKDRLIIPFFRKEELIGWTARAIARTIDAPRYLSTDKEIKTTVFNEDEVLLGGDLLFLVEGPFDALKLDYYGKYRARATCCFGVSMSVDQISIMASLRRRFRKVIILFDQEATGPAFVAEAWLQATNVSIGRLPDGVEDPGDLTRIQVHNLIKKYV